MITFIFCPNSWKVNLFALLQIFFCNKNRWLVRFYIFTFLGLISVTNPFYKMNNTSNLKHITGDQAYLIYWLVIYDCKVSISSVEAIDQNLEIIVNVEGDLLAYRYDYPIEIMGLMAGNGKWHLYDTDSLSAGELLELQSMLVSLRMSKSFMNWFTNLLPWLQFIRDQCKSINYNGLFVSSRKYSRKILCLFIYLLSHLVCCPSLIAPSFSHLGQYMFFHTNFEMIPCSRK